MNPLSSDEYFTLRKQVRAKTRVAGSVFIATAIPVNEEEDAKDWIGKISEKFFDATHNCFAFRIKDTDGETLKFSDAKEPRGSAGGPILSAIKSENLYNVLVVVTRYFGGVKLGTGRLSRAYRESALAVLQKGERTKRWICSEIVLSFPLNMIGKVNRIFNKYQVRLIQQGFQRSVIVKIEVRASLVEKIKKALVEATGGQVRFK